MTITIRTESPTDQEEVQQLIHSAFKNAPFSDHTEHLLVKRLRKSNDFIPELSLVAEIDSLIVGHILLTPLKIDPHHTSFNSLALAPVSVLPNFQGNGIGSQLIKEAHDVAKNLGYTSIILLGHKDYYPRFGYKQAHKFGISFPFEAPPENCMVIELVDGALNNVSGQIIYDPAFMLNQ